MPHNPRIPAAGLEGSPGLRAIDQALGAGDLEAVKNALFSLDDHERRLLEAQMGKDALDRALRSARSRRRGPGLGRVVVLPGLMGTQLESVDPRGDADRIWVNFFRMIQGRLDELKLDLDGRPLPPPHTVRPGGLYKKVYLPLLLALDERWQVRPFGYDWRIDIDLSAAALAADVQAWAGGEPAHLVVHSMGGLVARRFLQLFPDVWASMNDPEGRGRGGRLVMLGTPNRGSFAIPGALSGKEDLVKKLGVIDFTRGTSGLLPILNTFLGSYQTMPSPLVDLGDDHVKLFEARHWGPLPVFPRLLEGGRRFQEALHPVLSRDRLIYVAGFDQKTPSRVRIAAPGVFEYQDTMDGDGRVTHELGLLPDVRTFFVAEKHGDLVKNDTVLAAVHDLLSTGDTSLLAGTLSRERAVRRAERGRFEPYPAKPVPPELRLLSERMRPAARSSRVTPEQEEAAARAEALVFDEAPAEARAPGRRAARTLRPVTPPRLSVEVVWGDIVKVAADVVAVGHYHGVPPTNALGAIDRALSKPGRRFLLDDHVRRGLVAGELGAVTFFPWGRKTIAIAGMGHPGTFGEGALRTLSRNLTFAVANLPKARAVATVLIGSGDGGLGLTACLEGMFRGLADALEAGTSARQVRTLRIVEWRRRRANEIHAALVEVKKAVASRIDIALPRRARVGPGGGIGKEEAVSMLVEAAARAAGQGRTTPDNRSLGLLLRGQKGLVPQVTRTLRDIGGDGASNAPVDVRLVAAGAPPDARRIPTRLTFVGETRPIRVAAITNSATVAERPISIDASLVDDLVVRMNDPEAEAVGALSDLLRRLLVPHDFVTLLDASASCVFEVDRYMARVHWEMLAADDSASEPLSVRVPFARQLRTAYSPPPTPAAPLRETLTALVIGDPGDPDKGDSLPGARREALRVVDYLAKRGVRVVARLGAPDANGHGPIAGIPAADRLECLGLLMRGGFDLLHYAGHGDFDPARPDRVGWVFKGGLLTARELERLSTPPRLVVANACLSAKTSVKADDAKLTPSLADEFLRRGVRDYVGTAWEVNDQGAVLFAETLYGCLLPGADAGPSRSVGEALLAARQALFCARDRYGSLWAAYQHYGDPQTRLRGDAIAAVDEQGPKRKRARPRR